MRHVITNRGLLGRRGGYFLVVKGANPYATRHCEPRAAALQAPRPPRRLLTSGEGSQSVCDTPLRTSGGGAPDSSAVRSGEATPSVGAARTVQPRAAASSRGRRFRRPLRPPPRPRSLFRCEAIYLRAARRHIRSTMTTTTRLARPSVPIDDRCSRWSDRARQQQQHCSSVGGGGGNHNNNSTATPPILARRAAPSRRPPHLGDS